MKVFGLLTLISSLSLFSCATTNEEKRPTYSQVSVNYPDPVNIRAISEDVSKWSGRVIIQDRNTNGKVQSFVNKNKSVEEAYKYYLTLLDQIGLGAVEKEGIVQILPKRTIAKLARKLSPPPIPDGLTDEMVYFNYFEPTNIRTVIKDVSKWSQVDFVLDRNTNGKIQILSATKLSKKRAYKVFQRALSQLGLIEHRKGQAVQILPERVVIILKRDRSRTPQKPSK